LSRGGRRRRRDGDAVAELLSETLNFIGKSLPRCMEEMKGMVAAKRKKREGS
jgi:hypothetical protein